MSRPFEIYEVTPGRTWSLVYQPSGMEITVVTGKRRLQALLDFLDKSHETNFHKLRQLAFDWRKANPRITGAVQVESSILQTVMADAGDRLSRSIKRKNYADMKSALREIVEAKLQSPNMPNQRITKVIPGIGGASVAWRWVVTTGTVTLVADVPVGGESVVLSALISYPGVRTKPQVVFRETADPVNFGQSVEKAIQQITNLGWLRP